jgi:dihydroorotate dehydrogenase electron transfer subunit
LLLLHLLKHQSVPTTLLYGARTRQELVPLEALEAQGLRIRIATEDGLHGVKGTVASLLDTTPPLSGNGAAASIEAFVCGPMAMLRAVTSRLNRPGIRTHVSLESRMACGYGVCQGCVMPFKDKEDPKRVRYRKVCADGPVFTADEILWEEAEES